MTLATNETSPQIAQTPSKSPIDRSFEHISRYTESLLPYPFPTPLPEFSLSQQANANRSCKALADFWATEEGQDWKDAIEQRTWQEINTPELRQWWADFDRRYPQDRA